MFYVTLSGYVDVVADKATFGHLTNEKLSRLPILVPPAPEAGSITAHLDASLAEFEKTEHGVERKIDLIREYRTRLIADVVTGKLDVREAAAHLPEEAEEQESPEEGDAPGEEDADEEIANGGTFLEESE